MSFRHERGLMKSCRNSGFTLAEVLLVTVLFASIGLVVFNCLNNGLKLWMRSQSLVDEQDAIVFFDRIAGHLRNAFLYSEIQFAGEPERLAFPTVVYTPADRASSRAWEGYVEQIGMVRYSFDVARGNVLREEADYSRATRGSFGPAKVEVKGVKDLRFRYYYSGQTEPSLTAHDQKALPAGVEVEIRLAGDGAEKVLKRYVPIPAGS